MTRCLDEGKLQSYFDGELPIEMMENVTSHLASCVTCAAAARELEEESAFVMSALAAELESNVPTERLRERINEAVLGDRLAAAQSTQRAGFFSAPILPLPCAWEATAHCPYFGVHTGRSVSSMLRALAYSINAIRAASQRSALEYSCVDTTAPWTAPPRKLTTIRTWTMTYSPCRIRPVCGLSPTLKRFRLGGRADLDLSQRLARPSA